MAGKKILVKGLYNWTFLVIVIVAVILVNIISSFAYRHIDMTEDQRFSLAPGTITFLEDAGNFKSRLNIKIYLEGNLPAEIKHFRDAVEDKLKEFKLYAGDRIEYQFINPQVGTDEEQRELFENIFAEGKGILPMDILYIKDGAQSKLMLWPGAIIEYGGATVSTVQFLPGSRTSEPYHLSQVDGMIQNSINNLEYMLVSSLRKATQEYKPRVAFLQGHGELEFKNTQRVRAMISPYFSVTDIELNDSLGALNNVDGLIIARPTKRFSDKDLYIIDQYLMGGGRIMCFIDKLNLPEDTLNAYGQTHTTRYDLGLDRMLFDYGLKINDNYVIDARCGYKMVPFANQSMVQWFFHVLGSPTSHPISRNIEPVSLEYVSEVQFVGNSPDVTLTPVLTSSRNSTVTGLAPMVNLTMPINYGNNPKLAPDPTSDFNKKCLAGLAEGKFTSYFKNRIVGNFANNPESNYKEKSTKEGKVLVIGNGRFIENEYDSMPNRAGTALMYRPKQLNDLQYSEEMLRLKMQHFFGNQEFFQNITDYMLGENSVLDIRSRQIDIHKIDNEKVQADGGFYKLMNIGLPILMILLLGFTINYLRKRKFAH
jgi:ABC-2 type transport system permease protein